MTPQLLAVRSWSEPAAVPQVGAMALLLHGFGSDERDLPGLAERVLPAGIPWVSLRAPLPTPNGGAAWFPIGRPGSPDPEPVARSVQAITAWVAATLPGEMPLVPIGFSQGGVMVTELLRSLPDRVAAGAVLSGFVTDGERPGDADTAQARIPMFWGRGDADTVIAGAAVRRTAEWLPAHSALEEHVYPGLGHSVAPQEVEDLADFLRRALSPEAPSA